jgi:predicted RNase H-like nuclease (RuvC/YqgF family)
MRAKILSVQEITEDEECYVSLDQDALIRIAKKQGELLSEQASTIEALEQENQNLQRRVSELEALVES